MKLLTDLLHIITNISWKADIAAVLMAIVVGAVWYHESVFGKTQMALEGLNKDGLNAKTRMKRVFIWSIPLFLLIAANITAFCKHFGYYTAPKAMLLAYDFGLVVCLFMALQYLHEGRSWVLYAINAGYILVATSLMGMVIGVLI